MSPEHARKLGKLFVGGVAAWEAYANERDPKKRHRALNKIVRDNEPFIIKCVRALTCRGASPLSSVASPDFDDALNAGRKGYSTAIERFDPELGALPSFAKSWIRNAVQRTTTKDKTIHIPEQQKLPKDALDAWERIYAKDGRDATAEEMGLTPKQLTTWKQLPTVVSTQENMASGREDFDNDMALASTDPDPEALTGLRELGFEVSILPDDERKVITLLFWESKTVAQVARSMHLSANEITCIRNSALETLRASVT